MNKKLCDLSEEELEKWSSKLVVIVLGVLEGHVLVISAPSLIDTDPMIRLVVICETGGDKPFCATTCTGPRLYFFRRENNWDLQSNYMFTYDMPNFKSDAEPSCPPPYIPIKPLTAQVGKSVYLLDVLKQDNSLTFNEYNPESDTWYFRPSGFINNEIRYPRTHCFLDFASYVVIDHKLHISLFNATGGVSSFAFDTKKRTWEFSNLFDAYWSKQTDGDLSPTNFYGGQVWNVHYHKECFPTGVEENSTTRKSQPFGFYGKGIMWDKDVLLGLHRFSNEYQLVAFQLDGMGSVFSSQPFAITNLGTLDARSHLVDIDLDGSGHFGIVHCVSHPKRLDILTCKIQRASEVEVDNSRISIDVVKIHTVENSVEALRNDYNVFSL